MRAPSRGPCCSPAYIRFAMAGGGSRVSQQQRRLLRWTGSGEARGGFPARGRPGPRRTASPRQGGDFRLRARMGPEQLLELVEQGGSNQAGWDRSRGVTLVQALPSPVVSCLTPWQRQEKFARSGGTGWRGSCSRRRCGSACRTGRPLRARAASGPWAARQKGSRSACARKRVLDTGARRGRACGRGCRVPRRRSARRARRP